MERNFTNENFERFLRQNSDGLRMRPSEKVWGHIAHRLNRRKRRLGFLLAFTVAISSGLAYYFIDQPDNYALPQASAHQNPSGSLTQQSLAPVIPLSSRPFSKKMAAEKQKGEITTDQNPGILPAPDLSGSELVFNPVILPNATLMNERDNESGLVVLPEAEAPNQETGAAFKGTIVDEYVVDVPSRPETADENTTTEAVDPLTIESVVNLFKARPSKFSMQFYFTPSVSYRKLNDNHIDKVVTHKPDFGFEMGLAAKYKVAPNVKIRGGLQFNVNRYDIKTYESYTEVATIHFTSRFGNDSMSTATNYNNYSGKPNWLENFYFQVSAPVGVEVKLRGDDKVQFGIASTIQPTYILGDRAYLITTDYNHYADFPRLIRKWNVNTSLETFVAYSTGRLKWQVGPQVRYQLLSSYLKKYPVKENLFDFGLKVGISLKD